MDRGIWQAIVQGVEESNTTEQLTLGVLKTIYNSSGHSVCNIISVSSKTLIL